MTTSAAETNSERRWKLRDWLIVGLIVCIIAAVWCGHYHLWSARSWKVPVNYVGDRSWDMTFTGDALWGMAATKAMATGEIRPILPKYPKSFGAPFTANWNDFPSIEEGVNAYWAFLAWLFGIFVGSNLALLSAQALAGVVFYLVCRYLNYAPTISAGMAILFGLSRYAFWRSLANLSLVYYWHLPLGLLLLWWLIADKPIINDRRKEIVGIAIAVLFAVQSAYFTGMLMMLICSAAVFATLRTRDWRRLSLPIFLLLAIILTLVVMNVDTLYSLAVDGPNLGAAERLYAGVERYALRPIEFFLPRSHSLKAFEVWANETYFKQTLISGEEGSAYLGWVAGIAFLVLSFDMICATARNNLRKTPLHFWGIALILMFSVVGGLNGGIALFGLRLFRASNRYSIFIFAILLLYLAKRLTAWSFGWRKLPIVPVTLILVAAGIYDQVPPRHPELEMAARKSMKNEIQLVAEMERRLPRDAKVFQLPVYDFPEGPLIGTMRDYEHFRPYLHSKHLRFSYGGMKGRTVNRWQKEAEAKGPYNLATLLESYGFAAILINKNAYPDAAASLIDDLRGAGVAQLIAQGQEWICLGLNPLRDPLLPPEFDPGWHDLEGEWRWSYGDAALILRNPEPEPRAFELSFSLVAINRRDLVILADDKILYNGIVDSGLPQPASFRLLLPPGANKVRFITDRPGDRLSNGDLRRFGFGLVDFEAKQLPIAARN